MAAVATVIAVALILFATLTPGAATSEGCLLGIPCVVGHVVTFAVLGVPLAALYATSRAARRRPRAALVALLLVVAAFAAADELVQLRIEGRTADPVDWLADLIGAAGGVVGGSALLRRWFERGRR